MTNIRTRAMLCTLSISSWSARKHDKRGDDAVGSVHGVDPEVAGRFNKKLIDHTAKEFAAIRSAAGKIKTLWRKSTLPWKDDGTRILPSAKFTEFATAMEPLLRAHRAAVEEFAKIYPALRDDARIALNGLFDVNDYPDDVRSKFATDIGYLPLPNVEDFRVGLSDEQHKALRDNATKTLSDAIDKAVGNLYEQLHGFVKSLAKSLGNDMVFNAQIDNLRGLLDALPALNITDDPKLTKLADEIRTALTTHEPDALRKGDKLRKSVAAEAKRIENAMGAFMNH